MLEPSQMETAFWPWHSQRRSPTLHVVDFVTAELMHASAQARSLLLLCSRLMLPKDGLAVISGFATSTARR